MNRRRAGLFLAISLAAAACSPAASGPPASSVAGDPGAAVPEPASTPIAESHDARPAGGIALEDVTLSADRLRLGLTFIGSPLYPPGDPCREDYTAWVGRDRDALVVSVRGLPAQPSIAPPTALDTNAPIQACPAVGFLRSLQVVLDRPFLGVKVEDGAGQVLFVGRPPGLVALRGLPAGWELRTERDLGESTIGRWQRTYSRDVNPPEGNRGKVVLVQAFGGATDMNASVRVRELMVGEHPAVLFREPSTDELLLVWLQGGDGLALIVNESDFSIADLVKLAESAVAAG